MEPKSTYDVIGDQIGEDRNQEAGINTKIKADKMRDSYLISYQNRIRFILDSYQIHIRFVLDSNKIRVYLDGFNFEFTDTRWHWQCVVLIRQFFVSIGGPNFTRHQNWYQNLLTVILSVDVEVDNGILFRIYQILFE